MKEFRMFLICGLFLMFSYALINYMEIAQAQSHKQVRYENGQIKEDILFNNGQIKIFRSFDKNGKQVFNHE